MVLRQAARRIRNGMAARCSISTSLLREKNRITALPKGIATTVARAGLDSCNKLPCALVRRGGCAMRRDKWWEGVFKRFLWRIAFACSMGMASAVRLWVWEAFLVCSRQLYLPCTDTHRVRAVLKTS